MPLHHLATVATSVFSPVFHQESNKCLIHRIEFNHADIGNALKNARIASENFKAPNDACAKFSQMYGLLRWIEKDVRQHVHKEESILFPRVRQLLNSMAETI